jgi:hypothetical protein
MTSKFAALGFSFLSLGFAGCQMAHKSTSVDRSETGFDMIVSGPAGKPQNVMYSYAAQPEPSHRFIAVRHKLEILSSDSELPKSLESVLSFCGTIQCEVIASSLTARTRDSSASGSIAMRVAPQDFSKLFAQVEKQGNIVQHTTESEDKTSAVVDAEAKLKNLAAYRDSLRAMLGKPGVTVKDLVEIQEKLTDVQSELDSETATRKILANETEKIAVEINFFVERASRRRSGFTPIWDAIRDSGSNLGESLATLIMVIVAMIPWIVVIVPTIWLCARLWRKFRPKRNVSVPSTLA